MATEERVVLVAQLQDELSAPLNTATQAVDGLTKSTDRARGANGKMVRSVEETTKATDKARDASGRLSKTIQQVTGDSDQATGGMGRFKRAVQQVTDGVQSAGGAIRAGLSKPLGAAGNAVKSFAGGAFKTIGLIGGALGGIALAGGISRAMNIEQAQAKLKGLGHSAASVEQIMKNASASVQGTAFGLGDAAGVAAGAVAAGIKPGKDLERVLKLVGDGATIAGMDMSSMGSIFNKVAASGKLQGDVIAQLQDSGVPILQLVSKQMGVTAEEAAKMASDGKVSFETFTKAMEAGLGGAALKSGDTFEGAMKNTKAALGRIGETMVLPFLKSINAVFNAVMPVFDSINASLKPVMEKFGKRLDAITPKFAKWGGGITGIVALLQGKFTPAVREAFGWEEDSKIVGMLMGVKDGLKQMMPILGPLLGAFAALGSTQLAGLLGPLGKFLPTINPLVGVMIGLIATSPQLRAALGDAFGALKPVIEQVTTVLQGVLPVLAQWATAGLGAVSWILEGLTPALPVLVPLILGAVAAFKLIAPIMKLITGAQWLWNAAMAANPIGLIVLAIAGLVAGFIIAYNKIGWFKDGVNAAMAGIKIAIAAVVDWWNTTLMPALQVVGDFFARVFGWIGEQVSMGVLVVQAVVKVLVDWFQANLMPVINTIGDIFATVFGAVAWYVQTYIGVVTTIIQGLVDFWNGVLSPAINVVAGIFTTVLGGAISGITTFLSPVIKAFEGFIGFVGSKLQPVIDTIAGAFKGLGDIIGGVMKNVGDFASNPLGGAADWAKGVLGLNGGGVIGYAGGGTVLGGYAPGVDRVPALLSPGESVLVPELTRAIGPRNILAANHAASGGRAPGSTGGFSRTPPPPPAPARSTGGGGGTTLTIESMVINAQPGQSPADIGEAVREELEGLLTEANRRSY